MNVDLDLYQPLASAFGRVLKDVRAELLNALAQVENRSEERVLAANDDFEASITKLADKIQNDFLHSGKGFAERMAEIDSSILEIRSSILKIPDLMMMPSLSASVASIEGFIDDFKTWRCSVDENLRDFEEKTATKCDESLTLKLHVLFEEANKKLNLHLGEIAQDLSVQVDESVTKAHETRTAATLEENMKLRREFVEKLAEFHIEIIDRIAKNRGDPGKEGEKGDKGDPGALPEPTKWNGGDYARGACVLHRGGLWYAMATTDDEPRPNTHWLLLSNGVHEIRALQNPQDERELQFQFVKSDGSVTECKSMLAVPIFTGKWLPERTYRRNEGVNWDNSTWFCNANELKGIEPPGAGWVLGAKGERGKRGNAGAVVRGAPGVGIERIDADGTVALTDGRMFQLELPKPPPPVVEVIVPEDPVRWCGVHRHGAVYKRGDMVRGQGGMFIALVDTGKAPGIKGEDWELMMSDGGAANVLG